jgi:hypothetical protein
MISEREEEKRETQFIYKRKKHRGRKRNQIKYLVLCVTDSWPETVNGSDSTARSQTGLKVNTKWAERKKKPHAKAALI